MATPEQEEPKPEEQNEQLQECQTEEKVEKYINPELFNDDQEESLKMERLAIEAKPYFSNNTLPKSIYLQKTVLPLVYEALTHVEKIRPK